MEIIPLINEITNTFNETFSKNLNSLNLESKIRNVGDEFTLKLYEHFLNYINDIFIYEEINLLTFKKNILQSSLINLFKELDAVSV